MLVREYPIGGTEAFDQEGELYHDVRVGEFPRWGHMDVRR